MMRTRNWRGAGGRLVLAIVLALGNGSLAWGAATPEARPLLDRLEHAIGPLRDFQADFAQVRHLSLTDETVEAAGRLRFQAPASFRLDYRTPDPDVLTIAGDSMAVFLSNQQQLHVYPLKDGEATRNLFLIFSAGRGELEKTFDISPAPPSPDGQGLRLQPLAGTLDYPVREIRTYLNAKTGLPERLYFWEESGDMVTFRLSKPKTNPGLKPSDFVFIPPKGTETIRR